MGFTKRYFSKELILKHIENNFPLHKYFNVDACIFTDEASRQAYELSMEGHSDEEIKELLLNNNTHLIEQN
jgi:queuine/archaeosine tRNA-ribosyltransferase